jgi:hypothetical protein
MGDPVLDGRYTQEAETDLRALDELGIPILFADTPVPDWDPSAGPSGGPYPGTGPVTMNNAVRAARLNEIHRTLIGSHALLRALPYVRLISNPDGSIDEKRRPDGLHLTSDAVGELMDDGFEAAMRSAYRQVVGATPVPEARRNSWTG